MYNYNYSSKAPWRSYSFLTVTIENGVTSIGSYAFYGCTSLTSFIYKDLSDPGKQSLNVFYNSPNLKEVIVPRNYFDNKFCQLPVKKQTQPIKIDHTSKIGKPKRNYIFLLLMR